LGYIYLSLVQAQPGLSKEADVERAVRFVHEVQVRLLRRSDVHNGARHRDGELRVIEVAVLVVCAQLFQVVRQPVLEDQVLAHARVVRAHQQFACRAELIFSRGDRPLRELAAAVLQHCTIEPEHKTTNRYDPESLNLDPAEFRF
jgi:hypothetical protein